MFHNSLQPWHSRKKKQLKFQILPVVILFQVFGSLLYFLQSCPPHDQTCKAKRVMNFLFYINASHIKLITINNRLQRITTLDYLHSPISKTKSQSTAAQPCFSCFHFCQLDFKLLFEPVIQELATFKKLSLIKTLEKSWWCHCTSEEPLSAFYCLSLPSGSVTSVSCFLCEP